MENLSDLQIKILYDSLMTTLEDGRCTDTPGGKELDKEFKELVQILDKEIESRNIDRDSIWEVFSEDNGNWVYH